MCGHFSDFSANFSCSSNFSVFCNFRKSDTSEIYVGNFCRATVNVTTLFLNELIVLPAMVDFHSHLVSVNFKLYSYKHDVKV